MNILCSFSLVTTESIFLFETLSNVFNQKLRKYCSIIVVGHYPVLLLLDLTTEVPLIPKYRKNVCTSGDMLGWDDANCTHLTVETICYRTFLNRALL